jgi:hypothetical protein
MLKTGVAVADEDKTEREQGNYTVGLSGINIKATGRITCSSN